MEWLADPQVWIALVTLTALEIVLGVDNIIFIAILANRLPPEQQAHGRQVGLAMAFSTFIEMLKLRIRKGPRRPVKLRSKKIEGTVGG